MFPFGVLNNQFLFCCSQSDPFNNTCLIPTRGSSTPFPVNAGQVIFNRTSGSTSPNNTNTATTVTVTAAATITTTGSSVALASSPSDCPSSPSSKKEVAIGAGIGVPLGLAFLVALALCWIQRGRVQQLRKDVGIREGKDRNSLNSKPGKWNGTEGQAPYQLEGWIPNELDGRAAPSARADEIDGRQVLQMGDGLR